MIQNNSATLGIFKKQKENIASEQNSRIEALETDMMHARQEKGQILEEVASKEDKIKNLMKTNLELQTKVASLN